MKALHIGIVRRGVVIVAIALIAVATAAADPPVRFDPARSAAADVADAVARAKSDGKRVIVDVGGEWCTWCHVLDRFIASNPDVKVRVAARYVWVKVNYSKENRNERC